ncbi:MAG: NAD(P)H-binding protein [Planctomycetes bacterium]|nr:NAD(P)H-binding protein [Planctomycetota bacterium]MBU4399389.1 NAD(P)H-binding protein [Planctomycetota bacterium]MCG2684623.1 NAD(P)H-binding protein [Planctomycetales bacterium]
MGRHVVTGAFGYSGKYIAARLLDAGHEVHTLTNSPDRENPFGGKVRATPFNFDSPERMVEVLRGADALYNTYWVRFNHGDFSHSLAVNNTLKLFSAAKEAGVRRVVHVSISNPSEQSDLEYFRGKARLERELIESGLSCCILRPTVLFGKEDILVNNIAWTLRRLPLFGVFGDGEYRIQPIYVDDLASLAVERAARAENEIIDAIGPETFTFRKLVETIGAIIGRRRPIISVSPTVGYCFAWFLGKLMGDIFLTREEIAGLMRGLLCTQSEPAGRTKLTDWCKEHADTLGRKYSSELARRKNRRKSYDNI